MVQSCPCLTKPAECSYGCSARSATSTATNCPNSTATRRICDRVWLRANFIASLDGGATVGGTTGRLGGPGDRALFSLLRELADVILVGAGTVRVEDYSGARPSVAQRQRRQARGQSEVPQLAIVTKSGRLDRDMPVFTRTEVPPLVCTCAAVADQTRRALAGLAEVIDCSDDDPARVDEAAVLAALADRGLRIGC